MHDGPNENSGSPLFIRFRNDKRLEAIFNACQLFLTQSQTRAIFISKQSPSFPVCIQRIIPGL
jgi:hypothetical protein